MIQIPFTTDTFVIQTSHLPAFMGHRLEAMTADTPDAQIFLAAARFMAEVGYPVVTIDTAALDWRAPLATEEAEWACRDAKAQGMVVFRFTQPMAVGARTVTKMTVANRMCAGGDQTGLLAYVSCGDSGLFVDVDGIQQTELVTLVKHCCARILPAAVWS